MVGRGCCSSTDLENIYSFYRVKIFNLLKDPYLHCDFLGSFASTETQIQFFNNLVATVTEYMELWITFFRQRCLFFQL